MVMRGDASAPLPMVGRIGPPSPPLPPLLPLTWRLTALDRGKVALDELAVRVCAPGRHRCRAALSRHCSSSCPLPVDRHRCCRRIRDLDARSVELAQEGQFAVAHAACVSLGVDGGAMAAVGLATPARATKCEILCEVRCGVGVLPGIQRGIEACTRILKSISVRWYGREGAKRYSRRI